MRFWSENFITHTHTDVAEGQSQMAGVDGSGAMTTMIDETYEFAAPRFFDFINGETEEDMHRAELWFESTLSYGPSRECPHSPGSLVFDGIPCIVLFNSRVTALFFSKLVLWQWSFWILDLDHVNITVSWSCSESLRKEIGRPWSIIWWSCGFMNSDWVDGTHLIDCRYLGFQSQFPANDEQERNRSFRLPIPLGS